MAELQLGDVIKIIAPTDPEINDHVFFIDYIDTDKIRLEEANRPTRVLTLTDGKFDNESITGIVIKSHAEEEGYARQNNLLVGVWVDIHFSGDLPLIITGKITNLEKDKIELTTFPESEVIFIDFEYKGLPENLSIASIQIRRAPDVGVKGQTPVAAADAAAAAEQVPDDAYAANAYAAESAAAADAEKMVMSLPEIPEDEQSPVDVVDVKTRREKTQTLFFQADQIHFGEELEELAQFIDVPEEEQRYDISQQLDDLMDDILSTIPNAKRTDLVKNNIHKMVQRFKQLRNTFSVFDNKGHALMPKENGVNYKPLIEKIKKLEQKLYWLLPVVTNVKKIYYLTAEEEDEEGPQGDDVLNQSYRDVLKTEQTVFDNYEKNNTASDNNKYAILQKEITPYLCPFLPPADQTQVLAKTEVGADLMGIVDNYGSFHSAAKGVDTMRLVLQKNKNVVYSKRFATQNYIGGTTGLELVKVRGDNPGMKRIKLTAPDTMYIKSMLMLPEPTVRFSRINLNTASIFDKANLNLNFLNYWQLLTKKAKVNTVTIKNSHTYESETFLKNIKHFTMDVTSADLASTDKYQAFLETVIPRTRFLFNLIKPFLNGKLSVVDILSYLEPFMIYNTDLTYTQFTEMNQFILEKITEEKKKYIIKAREYGSMKGSTQTFMPSLMTLFNSQPKIKESILDAYGFTDTIMRMSNTEFMKRIIEIDKGVLFNTCLAVLSSNLMIADGTQDLTNVDNYLHQLATNKKSRKQTTSAPLIKLTPPLIEMTPPRIEMTPPLIELTPQRIEMTPPRIELTPPLIETPPTPEGGAGTRTSAAGTSTSEAGTRTSTAECSKIKAIAKRYIEKNELTDDNNSVLYFDKKYDPTPYALGVKYKPSGDLSEEEKLEYYINKLTTANPSADVRRDAAAIMRGHRLVEDGDYAILETPEATLEYYIRYNSLWVRDTKIDSNTFADNLKMFCNLNEKCIEVKNTCYEQTTGSAELKKHNLQLLLDEFSDSLHISKDDIVKNIKAQLQSANERIDILRNQRTTEIYKYDQLKLSIGQTMEEREIVQSPNAQLLNIIMGQSDMGKRYSDIIKFANAFIRDSNEFEAESPYWLYCIKTNTKLLPTFIYELAVTFMNKGNYVRKLDEICAKQGKLSDDGDKWIDQHSGYTIKMIELNADEEYNEAGFKIITREVMEGDAGDVIQADTGAAGTGTGTGTETNVKKFTTVDALKVYNVLETMSNNMGVKLVDSDIEFIVRNVLKQLSNTSVIPSKAMYEKLMLKAQNKLDSYENAYNSVLLYLTLAYFFIVVQTSIPQIKTKKTFPGCKKSFSGFPLDSADNMKGLNYVACVAHKIKTNAAQPWAAIFNKNATTIGKQLEMNITKFILPTEEIQHKLKDKKQYLLANPDDKTIADEHNVTAWTNYLPPLKRLKLTSTQDLGEVFKSRLTESLRKGKADQLELISELQSKMMMFSFNIIELIERTLQDEQVLFKTSSGEPFVENACCDSLESNTLLYFMKKQPEISALNIKVSRLSDIYDDAKRISKAAILFDSNNVKRIIKDMENTYSEETIYRAFIVYCKFNSPVELDDDLKAICPTKPDEYDPADTLSESIRKMKSNARNYSMRSLTQLLDIINNKSKQPIQSASKDTTTVAALTEIMSRMDTENVRPSVFRADFMNVLESFEVGALMEEDTSAMRKLKNVLARLNEDMQTNIIEFVSRANPALRPNVLAQFQHGISTITQFKETGDDMFMKKTDETCYKMIQFMKNTLRSLTREFPNMIQNKVNYVKTAIPAHWKLSQKHQEDVRGILKKHYDGLGQFVDDTQIHLLMNKFSKRTEDIELLAQNTIFYAPIEMVAAASGPAAGPAASASAGTASAYKYSAFDLDLTTYLFKFYFLTIFSDLISLQDDTDVLQMPLTEMADEPLNEYMDSDVLSGNKDDLALKIANIILSFTTIIEKDKSAIDYNYKSLMDLILRSKEKEKDEITDYLKNMTDEEREVEKMFKANKLGRWNKGEQKSVFMYDEATYDQERSDMEKMALREAQLNKNSVVTDMNRDIFDLDLMAAEAVDADVEREDNMMTYLGEDADFEEYGMDGDEDY